jgi:hypothetical protein
MNQVSAVAERKPALQEPQRNPEPPHPTRKTLFCASNIQQVRAVSENTRANEVLVCACSAMAHPLPCSGRVHRDAEKAALTQAHSPLLRAL